MQMDELRDTKKKRLLEFLAECRDFGSVLTRPKKFAERRSPNHEWLVKYSVTTRNRFFLALLGAAIGLGAASLIYLVSPNPPGYISKACQFAGATLGFAGAVGVPKAESMDGQTPTEKANEAGVFILSLIAFALGSYGVMVSP